MRRPYTYYNITRVLLAILMVSSSICTWAEDPEPTYVAKIDEERKFETLQAAIEAATDGQTVTLIANIDETATYTINKRITIDFNSHKITSNHTTCSTSFAECTGKLFSIASTAELTITGNGTITDKNVHGIFCNEGKLTIENGTFTTSNSGGYAVIFNTGSTANCTVNGGTFTGAYAAVYNVSEATMTISGGTISGYHGIVVTRSSSLTINEGATISGESFAISGNGGNGYGGTTININGGTISSSDDVAIYHPQIGGQLTIEGGKIKGTSALEVRSGTVNISGGTLTATASEYTCKPNGDGNTTIGAALAIAQHTTKQNISVTISGGEFTGVKAISESNPQGNDPAPQVDMSVTNGIFNGGITTADVHNFISGGTYSTVDENFGNYLQSGYAVKANSGEPATYSVVTQTKTEVNPSIEGDAKTAADALATNTATATTTGLAYDQSLEISIEGVTLDSETSVVKTATFNVTPKDVNGNPISSWSGEVTFRLPISAGVAADKWVNLKHNSTPIRASQVAADGDNRYVAVTTTSFSPFEYNVLLNDPVAQIGETKYETIAEAITAATAEETTIKILANITTAFEITTGKNIKLTIDTHTISGAITNAGTLSISDGTVSGNISNAGTLNISGGAIEGTITKTDGTISITGGTFTNEPAEDWIAEGYEVMVGAEGKYIVAEDGTAEAQIVTVVDEVENTTLYQTIADAIAAVSTNETTITVLKDIAADNITIPEDANITLVVAEGKTLSKTITNAGTLTISDGTFTGTITNNNETEGSLNITGGTFTKKPTGKYTCGEGKDLIINAEGKYVVTDIASAEAQIGDDMYLTIDKAITAAGETATTITLLKDLEGEERSIIIPGDANITLVIENEITLTKPINVEGKLAITSGTISKTTLTITDFNAVLKITAGVTHPAVALSTELLTDNVLKSKAEGETAVTTYWAEKKFEATIALTGEPTAEQTAAAEALVANTSIKEVSGHATNQSLTITVTSVELTASKVMKATFEVKLIGTDGEEVTGTVPEVTFHLPVSDGLEGKWANLWHNTTAIPGMNVVGATNGYVSVKTTSFSPFSYEIIETPIAQIGETKYGTVEDAIDDAPTSPAEATEIILVGTATEVDEAITVTENKNVKLTIGTHTITEDITNEGTLTIADGTISGAEKTITNTGALTISGGTISNPVTATAGTLTISGGTFSKDITTSNTAGLTITNGAINGALTVGGSGTNAISGGTISGAVTTNAATTISGGEITSNITNSAALTITNGTFTGTITNTGTVAISGGTHTVLPVSDFCATGYMPIKNEADKYNMTNHWTITDATEIDGSHFEYLTSSAGYKVATATYNRNTGMVSAGNAETMYGTICLPFNITAAPTGMTLYKATSIADNTLTITEVSYPVTAGTPLIFELSAVASSMTVESSDGGGIAVNTTAPATAPVAGNLLVGTYAGTILNSGSTPALSANIYYLNGDKFHQAVSSLTVPKFRAYLDVTGSTSARPLVFDIVSGENETTSINATEALDGVTAIYDLNGRKLTSLQRGVNIMRRADGSTIKVIVK